LDELLNDATRTAANVLAVEISAMFELDRDSGALSLRASVGLPAEVTKPTFEPGHSSHAAYTLAVGAPVIVEDWASEVRFRPSRMLELVGARSGITVPIDGGTRPHGVLGVQSLSVRTFTADEVDFLHAMANVLADAVARSRSEAATLHAALHDPLTGLPNRALFSDRLGVALAQARRTDTHVAVLFLDLDNFKMANDSRGHDIGDQLLVAVAARLDESLRPSDTVARFGGDEFVSISADLADAGDAAAVAKRIQGLFVKPFFVADHEHYLSASIGIAVSDSPLQRAEELIGDADAAMYRAKELGRGRYELFDQKLHDLLLARVRVHEELRHVIERDELRLYYQPIVSLQTGTAVGVEALVRWQHPERGLVAPDEFIPAAEQSGMIGPIGHWVLTEACRQLAAWNQFPRLRGPELEPLFVAVNISTRQIEDQALPDTIKRLLETHQLPPSQLHLEITESALLEDSEESLVILNRLKDIGIELVLDDFGTGYSSLSYVRRFPIDTLKIDRSFIADLGETAEGDSTIVEAILNMANGLGITVVAEGVETQAQADLLLALHCIRAQGWLYAPALPAGKLTPLLFAVDQVGREASV
jgi:diguanylate cyclase (GGDEF)-like protein